MPVNSDYKRIILPVFTVLWMAVIFWFSSAPAEESTHMSLSAGRMAARIFVPDFDEWEPEKQDAFAEKIDYPVRKTAHAGEYAVLGVWMYGTVSSFSGRKRVCRGITAWVAASVYAATDELHQLFVPGRSGQIRDVLLDSTGAAAGILLCMVIAALIKRQTRYSVDNASK